MKRYFEGWYFKQQNGTQTVGLIPGIADDSAFIQVITDRRTFHIPYALSDFQLSKTGDRIIIGQSCFTLNGLSLHIHYRDITITGELRYRNPTPLKSDIMGVFRFFPMECRHGVVSLHHQVSGSLQINGEEILFHDGTGYIEKDSGRSFPKSYTWLQSNDFDEKLSVMVSIAHIPFMTLHFQGLICAIWHNGMEYRLATYNGAKVIRASKNRIVITQGLYRLEADIFADGGHPLMAPSMGRMKRIIKENPACPAHFRFYHGDRLIFDQHSPKASFEHVEAGTE